MIKHAVINAGLGYAQARHGDTVILCDANMPIPNGCHVIDLSLVRGLPTLTQILNAVLNDMVAERHQVFELIPQYNPQMYQRIRELLRRAADLTGRADAFINGAYEEELALERQCRGETVRWSPDARQNRTLRVSNGDGRTWSEGILLEHEAGASDLSQSADRTTVYCFHEQGWTGGNCIFNRALSLIRIPPASLMD